MATLTIASSDPRLAWAFEVAIFLLAAFSCWRALPSAPPLALAALSAIGLWGFAQFAVGATVYRFATLDAGLRFLALPALFLAGCAAFETETSRAHFRRAVLWFGFSISVLGVLCYFTSPSKILWIFPSPYPDNWGFFPSRNNFAQFLELCLPVALYEVARPGTKPPGSNWSASLAAAAMLAAGLASASRAGALLLLAETLAAAVLLARKYKTFAPFARFAALAVGFTLLAGAGTLWNRFGQPDPFQSRREIYHSAEAMIATHPWSGYGLGTFATVYPEFAEFDAGALVDHAHNDWLEWAAEGGVPFAALWAVFALATVRPAFRTVWGLGVPALFLHALVDYPFARFGVSAWALLLCAAIFRGTERTLRPKLLTSMRTSVKFETVRSLLALGLALNLSLAVGVAPVRAAASSIGTIDAKGTFKVDEAPANGNATLFEGATVETHQMTSTLRLSSGPHLALAPQSKGRVFGDHLVLEKGSSQMQKALGFRVEARGLSIRPETGEASARVTLTGSSRVQVAALTGSFRVLTSRGLLVAALAPGTALEFEPQAPAANGEPWKVTGCLRSVGGHYLVTDDTTNVTVEVAGTGLVPEVGNRVELTGALDPAGTPVSGATQFIRVTRVRRVSKNGCVAGKGAAAAGTGGKASGGGHGLSTATTVAIIGGVAVAATFGGLAAADALPGQGSSAPVSR